MNSQIQCPKCHPNELKSKMQACFNLRNSPSTCWELSFPQATVEIILILTFNSILKDRISIEYIFNSLSISRINAWVGMMWQFRSVFIQPDLPLPSGTWGLRSGRRNKFPKVLRLVFNSGFGGRSEGGGCGSRRRRQTLAVPLGQLGSRCVDRPT